MPYHPPTPIKTLQQTVVTTNTTLDLTLGSSVFLVDTTGGALDITLPDPSTVSTSVIQIYDYKGNAAVNNISLLRHASENINKQSATLVLKATLGHYWIYTDGTDWFVMNWQQWARFVTTDFNETI